MNLAFVFVAFCLHFMQLDALLFSTYVSMYKRSYSSPQEYQLRSVYFLRAENFINNFTVKISSSLLQVGHNNLSDRSYEEKLKLLGLKGAIKRTTAKPITLPRPTKPTTTKPTTTKPTTMKPTTMKPTTPTRRVNGRRRRQTEELDDDSMFPMNQDRQQNNIPDTLPPSFTLVNGGYFQNAAFCMSPPKDQGACGSCWAFSAIASLEFMNCVNRGGVLSTLSEQQLIDCDSLNKGCNGGFPINAWQFLNQTGGSVCGDTYQQSYQGMNGTCNSANTNYAAAVLGVGDVPSDPVSIMTALILYGPLSAGMYATSDTFMHYTYGVYYDSNCLNQEPNHAVNIVGYGRDINSNLDYWIIRNSFSTGWGMGGYMYIQRGVNMCNIESFVNYVIAY